MAIIEEIPSPAPVPRVADVIEDLAGSVLRAVKARAAQLRREADTMTLGKVRRLVENDLKLEENFLVAHKDIVNDSIDKVMNEPEGDELSAAVSPKKRKNEKPDAEQANEKEVEVESTDVNKQTNKRLKKKSNSEGVKEEVVTDQVDDDEVSNLEEEEAKDQEDDSGPTEEEEVDITVRIREAAHKRASDFRSQADSLTLGGVRRLLEEDLKLEKGALDAHRQSIKELLDELLNGEEEEEPVAVKTPPIKRKAVVKGQAGAKSKDKMKKSVKKQKAAPVEEKEDATEEHSDDDEPGEEKEDSEMSDGEEIVRKKSQKPKKVAEPKPAYGKRVENLKSIIKACGMTVPPNVYRKAKQASEEQREGVLLKELEAILKREGLSAGASKDEIKAVRKRKEKLKDLEGIDACNIIVESRGRRAAASAINFFAPKRTEAVDLGDQDDEEEEEQESDSEDDPDVEPQDDEGDED